MIPGASDLGPRVDRDRDTILDFSADGRLRVTAPGECLDGRWEMPEPGRLLLVVSDRRFGPFAIAVERERLPLGEFTVLKSEAGLLPFDRRHFTREGEV